MSGQPPPPYDLSQAGWMGPPPPVGSAPATQHQQLLPYPPAAAPPPPPAAPQQPWSGYQQQQQQPPYPQQHQQQQQAGPAYAPPIIYHLQQQQQPPTAPPPALLPRGPLAAIPNYTPQRGRKKAVLIGCCYPGTYAALNGCINDVQCVEYCLRTRFGFHPSQIVVLRDDRQHADFFPTRANIMRSALGVWVGFAGLVVVGHLVRVCCPWPSCIACQAGSQLLLPNPTQPTHPPTHPPTRTTKLTPPPKGNHLANVRPAAGRLPVFPLQRPRQPAARLQRRRERRDGRDDTADRCGRARALGSNCRGARPEFDPACMCHSPTHHPAKLPQAKLHTRLSILPLSPLNISQTTRGLV